MNEQKQSMKNTMMESLRAKAVLLNSGIKLAIGREKAEVNIGTDKKPKYVSDIPFNEIVTLNNFEFSTSMITENGVQKESEFVAFTIAEEEKLFYFGGSVVTKSLKNFSEEELDLIKENGIPVKFEKCVSKVAGHNDYTKIIFFPEEV